METASPLHTVTVASDEARPDRVLGRPSRILIHAINFAPEFIGCAKYTTELAGFLASRGHAVEVVTAPPHYPGWYVRAPYSNWRYMRERLDGAGITRCPMLMRRDGKGMWRIIAPLTFAITAVPALAWRVLRFRPDVIFCVEPTLFSAPAALALAKLTGARSVLHVQDLEVDAAFGVGYVKSGLLKRIALKGEALLLRAHDQLITISGQMRQALLRKGVAPASVTITRNWIDLDRIHVRPRGEGAAYRAELGIDEAPAIVLYAGHVGPKQALGLVADAARILRDDPRYVFVIAGEGPSLAGLIADNADLPNLRFLPLQPVDRLNELLGFADIHILPQLPGAADLVLPSKLGGMLASGRPIVAMAEPGTELAMMLEDAAILVPCGDPQALAEGVREALDRESPDRFERRRALAGELDMHHVLPAFETMIVGGRAQDEELPMPQGMARQA